MQREPVPAALVRGQRLAAPFAIHPGKPGDVERLVVDGKLARHVEERLAVIIRRLFALRFLAEAAVALKDQRPVRVEFQRVAEVGSGSGQFQWRDRCRVKTVERAQLPRIDESLKRYRLGAGLADAATAKRFVRAVGVGARYGGVSHPGLLCRPAFQCCPRTQSLPEQGPLCAIGIARAISEVRRHIPPLDPKFGMRTVIGRKGERPAWNDGGKAVGFFLQPREPLRARFAGKREQGGCARKMAPGDFAVSAHWQRSGSGLAAASAPAAAPVTLPRTAPPAWPRQTVRRVAAGRSGTAAASRTPSHLRSRSGTTPPVARAAARTAR